MELEQQANNNTGLYELLGTTPGASVEQVRAGYRRQAMSWHPLNRANSEESRQRLRDLTNAYLTLANPALTGATVSDADAEQIFAQQMSQFAADLTAKGYDKATSLKTLLTVGCPEDIARSVTGNPPKSVAPSAPPPPPSPAVAPPPAAAHNPFQAPSARLVDDSDSDGELVLEGQKLPAGHGMAWLTRGWELYREAPLLWIGICFVMIIIVGVLGLIPLLGIAVNLLSPVLIGGIMLGCKAIEDNEELTFGHLFAGFSRNAGGLVAVGAIYLGGMMLIGITAAIVAIPLAISSGGMEGMSIGLLVMVLVVALLVIPLVMAFWLAPPLVVLHDVPAFTAMKASFSASMKNFLPFLVYSLVVLVAAILATIPIGLGWFVLIPVLQCSVYATYRDIFIRA